MICVGLFYCFIVSTEYSSLLWVKVLGVGRAILETHKHMTLFPNFSHFQFWTTELETNFLIKGIFFFFFFRAECLYHTVYLTGERDMPAYFSKCLGKFPNIRTLLRYSAILCTPCFFLHLLHILSSRSWSILRAHCWYSFTNFCVPPPSFSVLLSPKACIWNSFSKACLWALELLCPGSAWGLKSWSLAN